MPSFDANRPWRHLYGAKWRKRRLRFLAKHPLCVMCKKRGRVTPATVVDHIKDHKGDVRLFWDESNWQPLCQPDHDSTKRRIDGTVTHGVDGYPTDGSW